ncbi:MAG: DUF4127 family protein [Clostridia bacterium]|nr:DUF4127 family protein [Clostridia bacterium]
MLKIVYLSQDAESVNYSFPALLSEKNKDFNLVLPKKEHLCINDVPADFVKIRKFLSYECKDADYLIISLDALLYGGVVPSRKHYLSKKELYARFGLLSELKKERRELKIYAFASLMRSLPTTCGEGEPEYYGICGEEIFLFGQNEHLRKKKVIGKKAYSDNKRVLLPICEPYLKDYTDRRKKNLLLLRSALKSVGNTIDRLMITGDAASLYGYYSMDFKKIERLLKKKENSVDFKYGSDGAAQAFLTRIEIEIKNFSPKICPIYANLTDKNTERRINSAISVSGAELSDEPKADILLFCNLPAPNNEIIVDLSGKPNYANFVYKMKKNIDDKKVIALADNIGSVGGDADLLDLISKKIGVFRLSAYSSRNNVDETVSESLLQSIFYYFDGNNKRHRNRIATRVYEDVGLSHAIAEFKERSQRGSRSLSLKTLVKQYIEKGVPEVSERYVSDLTVSDFGYFREVEIKVEEKKEK